jgi:predicted O-methyltransferase YrrM
MSPDTSTLPTAAHRADETLDLLRHTHERGWAPTRDGKRWPVHPAGVSLDAALALHDCAERLDATRTLETGLGLGLSALALTAAVTRNAARSNTGQPLHTAIDPSVHWCAHAGLDLVTAAPVADAFRHIDEPSLTALPRLHLAGERFDLAFIDGAHHFETALLDIIYASMMLPTRGLCIIDDANMPPVGLAIEYAVSNLRFEQLDAPHRSLVVLQRPDAVPPRREWNDFVPFATEAHLKVQTPPATGRPA